MAGGAGQPRGGSASLRALFDWLFRSRRTGKVAIVQRPNLPLAIFLLAAFVRLAFDPSGTLGGAISVVSGVALVWWSVDEVVRGDCPFRRALGGFVFVTFVAGVIL
jgi:hypothetical protein